MVRKQIKTYKIKFDDIIHELDDEEFWYARELQKLLGFEQWRNFELIIHKAQTSCEFAGVMHRTILLKFAKWFLLGVAQNHQLSPGENSDGQGFAGECKKRSKAWASQPDRWAFS